MGCVSCPVRSRVEPEAAVAADDTHLDELVGVAHRKRAQAHGFDQLEHAGVRADPERQRHDHRRGEERRAAEGSHGIAQILSQHGQVLPWGVGDDAAQRVEPEEGAGAAGVGVAIAIREDQRELAAVLVAEIRGIEREQRAKRAEGPAGADRRAGHINLASAAGRWTAHPRGVARGGGLLLSPRAVRVASARSSAAVRRRAQGRGARRARRSVPVSAGA